MVRRRGDHLKLSRPFTPVGAPAPEVPSLSNVPAEVMLFGVPLAFLPGAAVQTADS